MKKIIITIVFLVLTITMIASTLSPFAEINQSNVEYAGVPPVKVPPVPPPDQR